LFLIAAPFIGVRFGLEQFLLILLVIFLVSFSLTALGFAIAWPMDSTQAFHAIINLFLMPLWMLSGALFPISGASKWVGWLMRINPLTYGTEALRALLFPATTTFSLTVCLTVLTGFAVVMFTLSFVMANRRSTRPAA
jgi:ABC-2 type transport system permease protein